MLQVNDVGVVTALRQVAHQEGFLSLWKGNLITILHRVPYSAINFCAYELTKDYLRSSVENDVARRFVSGAVAGAIACTAVSRVCPFGHQVGCGVLSNAR